MPMTQEHKQRHRELHKCLDELVADFIGEVPSALPSKTTVLELMQWSVNQTKEESSDGKQT